LVTFTGPGIPESGRDDDQPAAGSVPDVDTDLFARVANAVSDFVDGDDWQETTE
jgi:hypothetical protein